MDRSALDGLDLVPRLLAEVADDPDALQHRDLHLHGPLLHLPLEPSHLFSSLPFLVREDSDFLSGRSLAGGDKEERRC